MPVPIYEDTKPKRRKIMTFSTDITLPVCRKCKWCFEPKNDTARCTHPKIPPKKQEEMSLITGTVYPMRYRSCDNAREAIGPIDAILTYLIDGYTKCGLEGRKWEAKK